MWKRLFFAPGLHIIITINLYKFDEINRARLIWQGICEFLHAQ